MSICLNPWIEVKKGERRPTGKVLVSCETKTNAELKLHEAIHSVRPANSWGVTVARWHRGAWRDDRGRILHGVTHWMEMPPPGQ